MSFPRELSQFASFLTINDANRQIAITTAMTPFVGIGSTAPMEKLDVLGNIKTSGFVTATAYYGDGSTLSNITAVVEGYFVSTPTGIWTGATVGIGTNVFPHKLNVNGNVLASRFISNVAQGTAPFQVTSNTVVSNLNASLLNGRSAPSGNIVGTSDAQTLTNKTLTSPVISTIVNGSANLTVPTTSGTLIHTNAVGIITSGLYGSGSITNTYIASNAAIAYSKLNLSNTITNSDVANNAAISYTKLNLAGSIRTSDIHSSFKINNNNLTNNTISGIALGDVLKSLNSGDYLNGNNYNGSEDVTFSVNATTENVSGAIVARDGDGIVNATGFVGCGIVPIGGIIEWSGAIADAIALEPDWALCDGRTVNGRTTPDLRNRFIIGADVDEGGEAKTSTTGTNTKTGGFKNGIVGSHSHSGATETSGAHTHTINDPGHSHIYQNQIGSSQSGSGDPGNLSGDFPTTSAVTGITINQDPGHSHTFSTTTVGENVTNKNLPPYYALARIMRTK